MLAGKVVEIFVGGELGGADVEFEVTGEVWLRCRGASRGGWRIFRRFGARWRGRIAWRAREMGEVGQVDAGAGGPEAEDEGRPCEIFPGAAEIELMFEARGSSQTTLSPHEQAGFGGGLLGSSLRRSMSLGVNFELLVQEMRARVEEVWLSVSQRGF